jgi:flagellar biosynthesis/type III secretory pathway protein FliH
MNNLTSEEMEGYKKSVAEYEDVQLMMECSLVEGREEGLQKGVLRGRREGMMKGMRRGILQGKKEGMMKGIRKGMLQGKKEGMLQGKKEGMLQGKRDTMDEIAKNLLKMKLSMTEIAKATGLTMKQIQQL